MRSLFRAMFLAAGAAAALAGGGCRAIDRTPPIYCEYGGQTVRTGFTFEQFRAAMQREHRSIEVVERRILRSPVLEVKFEEDAEKRLVAVKVTNLRTGETLVPALFFGVVTRETPPAGP